MENQLDKMLAPVTPDQVCGDSLDTNTELYGLYNLLEQTASGKPEQKMGDSVIPAENPDWPQVNDIAVGMFGRTKDLRVAVYFCHAQVAKYGFAGLATGTELVLRLLESYWEEAYPKLIDEEYNEYAPDIRLNAINELASDSIINMLWDTPLVSSRAFGRYSYRDYCVAKGELAPKPGSEAHVPEQITDAFVKYVEGVGVPEQAFYTTALEAAQSLYDAAAAAVENLEKIDQLVESKQLDVSATTDFKPLRLIAIPVQKFLSQQLAVLTAKIPSLSATDLADGTANGSDNNLGQNGEQEGEASVNNVSSINSDPTVIRSRDDVIATLDRLCQYYERNEPSSPIPLVLKRAKNMVTMDFLSIMREISPDSLEQLKKLVGADIIGKA